MKKLYFILISLSAIFITASMGIQPAFAQTVTLGMPNPSSITFNDADPDVTNPLAANSTVTLSIRVRNNRRNNWRLTHFAAGDLSPSIPISNISWTVSPQPPFVNGSMSKSVAQIAAQGTGNQSQINGTFTFRIANLWSYNTGNFSVVTTFTLSAP
jgi:disulfide bond formation protein DsbB